MRIFFVESDGHTIPVNPFPTDSLRSALNQAKILIPKNSNIYCFCQRKSLHLDLSLSYQGIKDSDVISILMQKNKIHSPKISKTSWILNNALQEEKRQKEVYEEFARVSDVCYFMLDASSTATSTYQVMYEYQQMQAEKLQQEYDPEPTTIPQKSDTPSITPLPKCFENESEKQESEYESESVDSYDPRYSNIVYSNQKGEWNY